MDDRSDPTRSSQVSRRPGRVGLFVFVGRRRRRLYAAAAAAAYDDGSATGTHQNLLDDGIHRARGPLVYRPARRSHQLLVAGWIDTANTFYSDGFKISKMFNNSVYSSISNHVIYLWPIGNRRMTTRLVTIMVMGMTAFK